VSLLNFFRVHKWLERSFCLNRSVNRQQRRAFSIDEGSLWKAKNTLERVLIKNIIPFWYPGTIDTTDGGYRLNHDVLGTWRGPANKSLVTQARTLWFFSRLVNSEYGRREYIAAATHGYEFLRDKMWDREFGGFYWEVDVSGNRVGRLEKQTYGQAFALYALTEYAAASGDASAKNAAKEVFGLLESKAYDRRYGGYQDILQRDWSVLPASGAARAPGRVPIKRMNTHLHLLESMTTFYEFTKDILARERLIELILVNSNSVVRKDIGACTDQHLENWQPLTGPDHQRISYGHDLENIWLLIKACKSAGLAANLLADLYRTLFDYALQYGFDRKNGGFYNSGFFNARADRREKIWWVQAESLVAALEMYKLTGEQLYWDCFLLTLDWIVNRQVDWKHADWYEIVDEAGTVSGVKAGPWKGPYHNCRAMLHCLELLAQCSAAAGSHPA
jgi:cellobiose epimerase